MNIKEQILFMLSTASEEVSGQVMSQRLGVSRVAIWKQIQSLKKNGYDISSSAKGYRLLWVPDDPFSWEISLSNWNIRYFQEVKSTMDVARIVASQNCPDRTVIVAKKQTQGRGRLERTWASDEGGLFFTLVLRPDEPAVFSFRFNFVVSLAVVATLAEYGIEARPKWPNDIWVGDQKICGIISEMQTQGEMPLYVAVGVGVNVNNQLFEVLPKAVSIAQLLGKTVSRKEILQTILKHIDSYLAKEPKEIMDKWRSIMLFLGTPVQVKTLQETIHGIALDVDDMGALRVRLPSGEEKRIFYGDCFSDSFQL